MKIIDNKVSAIEPDFDREITKSFCEPGKKLLASIWCYQRSTSNKETVSIIIKKYAVIRHSFWSRRDFLSIMASGAKQF